MRQHDGFRRRGKEHVAEAAEIVQRAGRRRNIERKNLKIPKIDQLETVLQQFAVHYEDENSQCREKQVLRKAVSDKQFALPIWFGGLERACDL